MKAQVLNKLFKQAQVLNKEDFLDFEQLFQGYVGVAAIPNEQQANFLQLHLRENALPFYQTLGPATPTEKQYRSINIGCKSNNTSNTIPLRVCSISELRCLTRKFAVR